MSREGLQKRGNWQTDSGANAAVAEKNFLKAFKKVFEGTSFQIRSKPNEFDKIYTNIQLDPIVIAEIFTPPKPIKTHGIRPDYAIDNKETGKTLYVEIKRQDGWVEGGKRSDGRGNVHER